MKTMNLKAEIIRLKTEIEDRYLELAEWKKLYAELKEATIQGQIKGDKVNAELQSRIEHCPISEKCRAGGDDAT